MTHTVERPSPSAGATRRTQLDLLAHQLRAIDALNAARRRTEVAAAAGGTRETRMDLARSLEVFRREHEALLARVDAQLREAGSLRRSTGRRVLLAHRSAWFVDKVRNGLLEQGVDVVASLDNGADTVGAALAEQPDLVLVEDKIAMVPGDSVVRQLRRHCPDTVLVAHVEHGDRTAAMKAAGADAVYTRQAPAAEVVAALRDLLSR